MERKKSSDSTVQKAIQQHVVEHAERDKALKMLRSSTASKPNSRRLDLCLPLGAAGQGLESEVDIAHLFLTIIQFHSACHLISQHTSTCIHIDDEIAARIAKAGVAFGGLRAGVWERNGIKLDTKLGVYKAVVLPTLLYACETWTVCRRHAKRLNHFHLSCLGGLLRVGWRGRIPGAGVLGGGAGMQGVHTVLELAQLGWTGHVVGMPDARLPKKVFYGELREGKRSRGGRRGRCRGTLRASLGDFEVPVGSWGRAARGRSEWRGLVNKGAALYEKKRICEAERGRRERKARADVPPADSVTLTCSACGRQFRARIGLVSHQRTHQHTSALFKK